MNPTITIESAEHWQEEFSRISEIILRQRLYEDPTWYMRKHTESLLRLKEEYPDIPNQDVAALVYYNDQLAGAFLSYESTLNFYIKPQFRRKGIAKHTWQYLTSLYPYLKLYHAFGEETQESTGFYKHLGIRHKAYTRKVIALAPVKH